MTTASEKLFSESRALDFMGSWLIRRQHVEQFGFSVLTEDTIKKLAKYSPFVEVGAGTGYWSFELIKHGLDSIATDLTPYKDNHYPFKDTKPYVSILQLDAETATRWSAGRRTLLMSWPCYGEDWAYKAAKAYTGDTIIYCGEGNGGCTADDQFHELMDTKWNCVEYIAIPQFHGIHDGIHIYQRRNAQ